MKTWVIPDLHGCAKTLRVLVEEKINPGQEDQFYFLGDYLDRGPDPKGVIDFIMHLEAAGFGVRALKGNHEEYLLLAYEKEKERKKQLPFFRGKNHLFREWMHHGGEDTLKSFGVKSVADIPAKYIGWLNNLELFIQTDDYVIVHAGMNFDRRDPFDDQHAILWTMSFTPEPEKIGNRTIIHGHVPVSLEFLKHCLARPERKYIPLDNGCYLPHRSGMGHLVALELESKELVLQRNVER
ncbi:MAG: metallophosphoesterase [Bacteroidales bacterium]